MCETVCVCLTELTAFTAVAAEVAEPEEIRSQSLTTDDLACGKRSEARAHQEHLLSALHPQRVGEPQTAPRPLAD